MSTELTLKQKAFAVGLFLVAIAVLVTAGLLLREYAPGNMGNGFLGGAGLAVVASAVALWRVVRRPERTTTFERGWTQAGDERDDAVLTRSLAVLGLLALPTTGAASMAIAVGAPTVATLGILMFVQIGVFVAAFVVINRRS